MSETVEFVVGFTIMWLGVNSLIVVAFLMLYLSYLVGSEILS